MKVRGQIVCQVSDESTVGAARRCAARLAANAGLSETDRGRLGIVVTELARNIALHSGRGALLMQELHDGTESGVEVLAVDSGPGIEDIERSMNDGYSTAGTAGTGMGAVRRLSNEFDVYTRRGAGAIVLSRVRGGNGARAPSLHWGAAASPAPGETRSGDAWSLAHRNGDVAVLVADGLGHGAGAADAAELAVAIFDSSPFRPLEEYFAEAHRRLHHTRGAAIAAAHLETRSGKLRYAGIGNIAGRVLGPDGTTRGLVSNNGTVGAQIRQLRAFDYDWHAGDLLVMHTDGLKSGWSLERYPGLASRHPAVIGALLHRDFRRGPDDTAVLVLRRGG
jgi:anti-sigma regulatory factor (Ser/Thr protein kinase)